MAKRWVKTTADIAKVNLLQQQLKIHPIFCELLVKRGIETYEEAHRFFRPQLSHLHDPFLMKDMDVAVSRIAKALTNKEKILVYGDYDVDGTTSVALIYSFFKPMYPHIDYYIPDRYTEGYGISFQGIDFAKENGFSLIISLDCGIKAMEQIDYANERGIDFVICDHHRPGAELPKAHAILDPKREDCNYPYKELSGCGVGYKLLQAYCQKYHDESERLNSMLDIVAVSIAADIVPITGENRVLAYYGLQILNQNPSPGLKQLIESANVKGYIAIDDIVFKLAPRINAAGRMEDGKNAVKLLVGESAFAQAEKLNKNNIDRKQVDMVMTREALEMIENDEKHINRKSTVLFNPEWHKGVVGIVASRLIDSYYRPTVILTESNGQLTGSARSIAGFDVYNAIEACSEYLDKFGGHTYAAGLTMPPENFEKFAQKFEEYVQENLLDELLTPEIIIDADIELNEINDRFYKILKQFAPFGPNNMRPVFRTCEVYDTGQSKIGGTDHLQLHVTKKGQEKLKGIGFGMAYFLEIVTKGPFDMCYVIDENLWRDKLYLQLLVKDIK
jgi:single-stranded-DNA-specific exonuclease